MKFRLVFDCDNAAFDDDTAGEIAAVLRELAARIDGKLLPSGPMNIGDRNGNFIGTAQITGRLAGRR